MNIPVAGYRQSGEMETVVPAFWKPLFLRFGNRYSGVLETVIPAIWEPLPRKGMFRLLSSGPSQIIRSGFYQARTPPA